MQSVRAENIKKQWAEQSRKGLGLMNKDIGRDTFNRVRIETILGKYGVYIALLVLFVTLSIASSSFLTVTNLFNILKQNSVYGILAVGMTFVIVTGGIDLSVGAIVAMSACFAASLAQDGTTTPILAAILVGLLIGNVIKLS